MKNKLFYERPESEGLALIMDCVICGLSNTDTNVSVSDLNGSDDVYEEQW